MAVGGKALASESLEAEQHYQDPLLESFLTPRTSSLTYQEVVDRVLMENRWASKQSLRHLQERGTCEWEVLEGLNKVHGELDKADKATQKSLKKEIDQRHKGPRDAQGAYLALRGSTLARAIRGQRPWW